MRVGIGLPSTLPETDGTLVIEWAKRADAGLFSCLGVLDRLVYDSYDPLAAFAAAAAVTPRAFARAADKARAAWYDSGRPGKPQLWAQGYFALGNEHIEAAGTRYLKDYYAFTGPFAERIAAGLLTSPQAIAQFMRGYEEAGCDELVLFPTVPDLEQLEQLADTLNGLGRKHPHRPRSVDRIAL